MLDGLKVIEIGQVIAGPYAGAIFADLGAEVIKVERAAGDDGRRMGPDFRHGDALLFHIFNRGKRSVAIDLGTEEGLAGLERLLADADVLIHNLRPGVAEKLGIGGAALTARYPRLVYCEISAFGHVGPDRMRPGYDPMIQAYSGLSSTNGGPDDPPMRFGAPVCDQGGGMWAVIGALAMLRRRDRTGRGGIVNLSLLETALSWSNQRVDAYANGVPIPGRHRSGHVGNVPYQAFDAADAPMVICVGSDPLFVKLAVALGRPEWPSDPRYRTNRDRVAHKDVLLPAIQAIVSTAPRAVWLDRFAAAGVPATPVNTIPEAVDMAQVAALGLLQEVPGEGGMRLTGLPLSFDGERLPIRRPAPRLGGANRELGIPAPRPAGEAN